MRTLCTVCGKPSVARSFCKKHYRAFMAYGDPLEVKNLRGVPFERRYTVDQHTKCWLWIGSTDTCGYGIWNAHGERSAHRASYAAYVGPINGLHVLHKCDQPNCVNPEHLFLGTHADNMADLRVKGRAYGAKGSANFSAKLNEAQAVAIMGDPRPCTEIGKQYGVTGAMVDKIRNGKSWAHLFDGALRDARVAASGVKLSLADRAAIAVDPRKQADIAAAYGVSQGFISAIKRKAVKEKPRTTQ